MKLASLNLALDLASELGRLDEIGGAAELHLSDRVLSLEADEVADFVAWKRARIERQLAELGIDMPGMAAPALVGFDEIPEEGRSGTAREAPSTGLRDGTASAAVQTPPMASIGLQAAAPNRVANIAEAREIARERILGPILKGSKPPLSDDPEIIREWRTEIDRYAERRSGDIETLAREILHPPATPECEWSGCADAATTLVGGKHYCSPHGMAAPRGAAPDHLRLVLP